MTLEIKDIVYVIVYIVSLASVVFSFFSRVLNLEREVKRLKNVMYAAKGGLNLIDLRACSEYRRLATEKVRETQSELRQLIDKLELINQNIGKILVYVEILRKKERDEID